MHGPKVMYKEKMRKSYLIAIIDDHSRLMTAAGFYRSENLKTYLKVLEQAFLTRGLPRKLYVDNGPAFRSHHLKLCGIDTNLFSNQAITAIQQGSGGLLRKANNLARGSLIAAAAEQSMTVSAEQVRIVSSEIF